MAARPRPRHPVTHDDSLDDEDDDIAFSGLHWLTAGLFLAAGTEAGLGERRGDYPAEDAVRWGPLIAAPIAGAAHAGRALFPGRASRFATQILNGLAVAVGAAGVAGAMYAALHTAPDRDGFEPRPSLPGRLPSLAPLTFALAGLTGVLLDREERLSKGQRDSLLDQIRRARRRARLADRFLPRRRTRFDRVVLHV
jgi:hypothetical protein